MVSRINGDRPHGDLPPAGRTWLEEVLGATRERTPAEVSRSSIRSASTTRLRDSGQACGCGCASPHDDRRSAQGRGSMEAGGSGDEFLQRQDGSVRLAAGLRPAIPGRAPRIDLSLMYRALASRGRGRDRGRCDERPDRRARLRRVRAKLPRIAARTSASPASGVTRPSLPEKTGGKEDRRQTGCVYAPNGESGSRRWDGKGCAGAVFDPGYAIRAFLASSGRRHGDHEI